MIFRKDCLAKILKGEISIAFRQWQRLGIKEGGTLKTSIGVILFKKIRIVTLDQITNAEARKAGFSDVASLLSELSGDGIIYRICFVLDRLDPRIELRERSALAANEKEALLETIERLDSRGAMKNWVLPVMRILIITD